MNLKRLKIRWNLQWYCFGLLFSLQACFLLPNEQPTLVKGQVLNSITGESIEEVPIEVWECKSGLIEDCTLLTTIFTDKYGNYQTSFNNKKKHHYKLTLAYSTKYDLTSSPDGNAYLESSESNIRNFHIIPYKIIKINLKTSKSLKDRFVFSFQTADSNGNMHSGTIWHDETKKFYQIDTTFYHPVIPYRNYRFDISICDKTGTNNYQNCEWLNLPNVYVEYVDTTYYQIAVK